NAVIGTALPIVSSEQNAYVQSVSRMITAVAIIVCSICALAEAGRAQATAERSRLRYELAGDSGSCPDVAFFREEVSRRAGSDPFTDDADVEVLVRVEPKGNGFEATIELRDETVASGSRILQSSSCTTVVRAASLAVVVMLKR